MGNTLPDKLRAIRYFAVFTRGMALLLCYLLSAFVTGPVHAGSRWVGAMLAAMAALVVLQEPDVRGSIRKGWLRVLGTFIGAMLACLYLTFFPFSVLGLIFMVYLLDIVCPLLHIPDKGQIAALTLVAVLFVSQAEPDLAPVKNGALRFLESAVGAGIGVSAVWLNDLYYQRRRKRRF